MGHAPERGPALLSGTGTEADLREVSLLQSRFRAFATAIGAGHVFLRLNPSSICDLAAGPRAKAAATRSFPFVWAASRGFTSV